MTKTLVDAGPLLGASARHFCCWLLLCAMSYLADPMIAKSLLIGATIAILPAVGMAWAVFRLREPIAPGAFTRAVYRGELGKFLSTIVLFALVFAEGGEFKVEVLFGAFLAALVVQWVLAARHLLRY